ncbi:MAG: hypothetical protein ACWA5U_01820 [bacterium]
MNLSSNKKTQGIWHTFSQTLSFFILMIFSPLLLANEYDRNNALFIINQIWLNDHGYTNIQEADEVDPSINESNRNDWPNYNSLNLNKPDGLGVFMANGIIDPNDTNYVPPSFDDFNTVIMGRSEAEKLAREQEAYQHFQERYGMDFFNGFQSEAGFLSADGKFLLTRFYTDPRLNYRAYKLPNRNISPSGWFIHDGGYFVTPTAEDSTFYGTYGGATGKNAKDTMVLDGEYLVQGSNRFEQNHPNNVHIRFQSTTPIVTASAAGIPVDNQHETTDGIKFNCRLISKEFGEGLALGRQEIYLLADGTIQTAINNVLRFPTDNWAKQQDQ